VPSIIHALKMRRQKKEAIQAFLGEIRTISRLRHPNICLVLGAVLSKEEPMLVMEHMEHGSLYDVLHNETAVLDGFLLKMIVSDIIQGMLYISSFSPPIVHGDLKARNILIDSTFRGKVTGEIRPPRSTSARFPHINPRVPSHLRRLWAKPAS
jgi:serine/threonine protein kinase